MSGTRANRVVPAHSGTETSSPAWSGDSPDADTGGGSNLVPGERILDLNPQRMAGILVAVNAFT